MLREHPLSSFVDCTPTMPVVTIAAMTAAAEPMMIAFVRLFLGGGGGPASRWTTLDGAPLTA
ncbi:hypothetical protein ACQEVY_24850 [Streptomyces sp. CA-288835]|uniref:hypothetical protein n=1 Tax=Streptomyces sp. CA-288835 TaxID=3240069 RepID=UPI003D93D2E6